MADRTVSMKNFKPNLKENYQMHGMDKKQMLRKKALESMMKDGPSIAIQIKKKSSPMEMGQESEEPQNEHSMDMAEDQENSGEPKGYESMMISPEEKKILHVLNTQV